MRRLSHRLLLLAAAVVCAAICAVVAEAQTRGTPRGPAVANSGAVRLVGAPCNGSGDDVPALGLVIGALPTSGGTIDARACTSMTIGSTLTISKAAVTILLPAATLSLGANQIVVPVGVHSVSLIGPASYGSSVANAGSAAGTRIAYSGNGAAIQVGDSTSDTFGFQLQDVTVDVGGAGSAAIGIQLNRAIGYALTRPRVGLSNAASTQIAIDLEGFTNYTGGRIDNAWISGGGAGASAYFFGKNANANFVTGGHVVMAALGSGTAFNIAGAASGNASGNMVFGGDVEGCLTVAAFDFASGAEIHVRSEACTNQATATVNSQSNAMFASGTGAMAIADLGSNNSFTDQLWTQLGRTVWKLKNTSDTASSIQVQAGSAVEQIAELQLSSKTGALGYRVQKDASNNFVIVNKATSATRLTMGASNTTLFAEGGGQIITNASLLIGGALTAATLPASTNGSLVYCSDCTITNPCAGGGTGALAKRINGVWVCN